MRVNAINRNFSNVSMKQKSETVKPIEKRDAAQESLPYAYQPAFLGDKISAENRRHMRSMEANFSPEAERVFEQAKSLAKKTGSPNLELKHLYFISLATLKNFIKECNESTKNPIELTRLQLPHQVERIVPTCEDIFTNDKKRAKIEAVVDKHMRKTRQEFIKPKKGTAKRPMNLGLSSPAPSKRTIQDLADTYDVLANRVQSNNYTDEYFLLTCSYSQDRKLAQETVDFFNDIRRALIVEEPKIVDADHLTFYDNKADLIWKNINLGNDALFLYDTENKEAKGHLISSLVGQLNKAGNKYKNIDPEKTDIICLNEHVNFDFLETLAKEARTDKSKEGRTTVIIADFQSALMNNGNTIGISDIQTLKNSPEFIKNNSKLRFIFSMPPEAYYANVEQNPYINELFTTYAVQTIPSLTALDAKKYLTDERGLKYVEEGTKRSFTKETIEKAIELTSNEEGNYPEKAMGLLSKAAKYYIDSEEILPSDLEKYLSETRSLSDISNNNGQQDIVFDTGKRLSDIVGSPMTKADAKSIVSQIKTGTIGTKGFRAYLEDGSSYGGGRRHTAEAIAGEAGIPMITINAKEFALKDIDALSQNADLSEMKIKKIVATAKAQAEANPNKAAMIFIKNFDDFAPNPLYMGTSVYQSKAFSQLLSEMESARLNDDVNLIVVGSVNTPELIDPNIMKPYKFLNSIIVYPPQDSNERKEVLNYYINKMGLEIAGESEEEKGKIVSDIADTTSGFTVVDLMYLLETVNGVSKERNKDKIDSSDFNEAFLQVISGRPNMAHMSENDKRTVASHEAGHAVALQVLYEIAEKQNIPWHLPNMVNFITLDPRGNFGGAMFHKSSDNHEYSFEKIMSDMVCSYGGHSAENTIYNMSGSLGITADMEHVASIARAAVLDMGMGPKTGVCHIPRNALGSPDVSQKKLEAIEADIDLITSSAKKISDMIIEIYKDFIISFTDKYANRVGTGECIISSEEFQQELNNWRNNLPEIKKEQLKELEQKILEEIKTAKTGGENQ